MLDCKSFYVGKFQLHSRFQLNNFNVLVCVSIEFQIKTENVFEGEAPTVNEWVSKKYCLVVSLCRDQSYLLPIDLFSFQPQSENSKASIIRFFSKKIQKRPTDGDFFTLYNERIYHLTTATPWAIIIAKYMKYIGGLLKYRSNLNS